MEQYIDKAAIVTEIERRKKYYENIQMIKPVYESNIEDLNELLSFINTLDVKEVETWHLQEKEDIYDAVKDWGLYKFVCVMKDGTVQRFNGCLDEDYEGHIHVHIDGINDDYDNVDDIVKWIEYT
jgi:hypothetical protein